jgi:hypothetical protein
MVEDNEDRRHAAERLSQAAAHAYSSIACDGEAGDEVRLSAAEQLAEANPYAAAEAFAAIARDREVGDEVRLSAAEQLGSAGHHRHAGRR